MWARSLATVTAAAALAFLLAPPPAVRAQESPVMSAMQDELARSIAGLKVKDRTLIVNAEHTIPGAEQPNKDGHFLTHIALVNRFDGPVNVKIKVITLK